MRSHLLLCFLLIPAVFLLGCQKQTAGDTAGTQASASMQATLAIVPTESPATGDAREPELNSTADGRIILSWVERVGAKRHVLRAAIRDGQAWSEVITVRQGDNWFVNWADFPSVIALADGSLAAHWLVKSGPGTYAYNVNLSRSKDGGKTWTTPIVPHLDNTQTEHGFVSLLPLADGKLGAVWLDGRNMKDIKEGDEHAPSAASMTLRYAAIDETGKLFDEAELDERVCECCQTSAALTSEGAIVVYRDRSADEIRDIYAVRQQGGWANPKNVYADNWKISGCPVNGPSVSVHGGRVVVAWFTGADDSPRVKVAFSDNGSDFSNPIEVDEENAVGRVDVLMLPDGSAMVCWMSGTVEQGAIKARRVRADGQVGPASVIAETSIARSSGFPRMARIGDEVHFAWTEFGKPSRVRMAKTKVTGV